MNPKKHPRVPKRPAPAAAAVPAPRRRPALSLILSAAAVVALALIAGWWWWSSRQPALPAIDLAKADPAVAATLHRHRDAVRKDPRSADAWGWLGALLWAYDFRPEARECLARAEALDPANARWPYFQGLSLMVATPIQAVPFLQRASQICGTTPETPRFVLAHLLAEQGRWDEARLTLEPLLKERPAFAPARLLAARHAHTLGNIDNAIDLARSCTEDARTARSANVLLSALYRQKGNTNAAAQALQSVSSLPSDQGIEDPYYAELTLLREDPRALCEQAHPLLAAGRLPQAAQLIDKLRQKHPQDAETWLLAGRLHFLRKDLAAAEDALRRHVEMNPHSVQGFFQFGAVLLARGKLNHAVAMFDKAIELKPDFGQAHYNRGLALGRAGHTNLAVQAFYESLRHNPERLETYLFLADLHLRAGEMESARALLTRAASINPNDPRFKSLLQRLGHAPQ